MLEMLDALKAKSHLDNYLRDQRREPMTGDEAEAVEAILTSPAGSTACQDLSALLWVVRDLVRCGSGVLPGSRIYTDVEAVVGQIEDIREKAGKHTVKIFLDTARAILRSPIGIRAGTSPKRLDAAVELLFAIRPRPKKDAA